MSIYHMDTMWLLLIHHKTPLNAVYIYHTCYIGSYGTRWANMWLTLRNNSSLSLQKELARVKDETIGRLGILRSPNGWVFVEMKNHTARLGPQKTHAFRCRRFIDLKFISCFFLGVWFWFRFLWYRLNSIVFGRVGVPLRQGGFGVLMEWKLYKPLREFPWWLAGQKLPDGNCIGSYEQNTDWVFFFIHSDSIPTGFWIIFDPGCAWW